MNSIKNNNKNDNTLRSTKKDTSVTGRTLYYFGKATLGHWPYFLLDLLTSTGYAYFLTFGNPLIIARIIDRIGASQVTADQVFPVFGPHILALILCNVLGQVCSKLQDYSLWKLQILVYYDLSSMCFDVLANQSMTFHNNRYGGSLVSQTSKFTSAYNQLMQTLTFFLAGGNAWFGISAGTLVMMFSYTNNLTLRFNMLTSVMQSINHALGDAHDMTVILDEPRLVADLPDAPALVVKKGDIDFSDLSFWYTGGGHPTAVFEHFDLHIPAGQRIGLVGKSGSGKTTLTRLLLRRGGLMRGDAVL